MYNILRKKESEKQFSHKYWYISQIISKNQQVTIELLI